MGLRQDGDAVLGAASDLGGRHPGFEPLCDRRVVQVAGAAAEQWALPVRGSRYRRGALAALLAGGAVVGPAVPGSDAEAERTNRPRPTSRALRADHEFFPLNAVCIIPMIDKSLRASRRPDRTDPPRALS